MHFLSPSFEWTGEAVSRKSERKEGWEEEEMEGRKDPVSKSGNKAKTKSKGKVQDKFNKLVLFHRATYEKPCREITNHKLVTQRF